jgi:hypothetical protein
MKTRFFFLAVLVVFSVMAQNYNKVIISNNQTGGAYGILEKDLDNDGDLDLMGAAQDTNTLFYFINDGNGNFTETIIDNTLQGAAFIDGADFDNDGDMDFAAIGSSDLVWYENNNGSFIKHNIASGLNTPFQLRTYDVGDILDPSPDGDIDIGLLIHGENSITVYLNDGSNNFSRLNLISYNTPKYLHGGDFDLDGNEDILVSSSGNNEVVWYKLGTFGFVIGGTIVTNFNGAFGCEGGDIDLDGDDDVIAAAFDDNEVAWFENEFGDGSSFIKHTIDNNLPGASYVHWLDIDNDGDKDIVATGYGNLSGNSTTGHQVVIYYNDGTQNFTKTVIDNTEMEPATFSVQDFTGDNQYDVAFAANVSGEFVLLSEEVFGINQQEEMLFTAYPNPATDFITVKTEQTINKIQLFDITGQLILETKNTYINLENIQNGYYLLQVLFEDKTSKQTRKILVK